MKKIFAFLLVFGFVRPLCAADRPIDFDRLPAEARQFITTHFDRARIVLSTVDKELFDSSYTVAFDG
jgi:hypothetical protein